MKKTYLLPILSIAASLGFVSLPAYADKIINYNTQVINQTVIIDGNGNTVNQSAGQATVQTQSNGKGKKSATATKNSQQINQGTEVYGNNNNVNMTAQQVNVSKDGSRKQGNRDDDKKGNRDDKKNGKKKD